MTESVWSVNPLLYLLVPAAFLTGSIPFGIFFTRKTGLDIRKTGSGNIGATNVLRSVGKGPALLTLASDIIKGVLPVLLCSYLVQYEDNIREIWMSLTGLAAVTGHMFSIFMKFKGGKGVATGLGVIAVYSPFAAAMAALVWIIVVAITRYVSLGSMLAAAAVPAVFVIQGASFVKILFGTVLAILIIFKHSSNIRNLTSGKESKIGARNKG